MFKKLILITSYLVFSGLMVIGAIYRTEARINLVASPKNENRNHNEDLNTSALLTWQTMQGIVTQVDVADLTINVQNHQPVLVEGQPLAFAISQGFTASLGDTITLEGYEENGEFRVGRMTNLTSGQQIELRNTKGQPAWRGQGRGN